MNLFTNVPDETGSGLSATLANWPPSVGDGGEVGLDTDAVMEDDNQYVSSARVDDLNIQDVGLREDQVEDDFVSSSADEPRGELTSSTTDASIYDDSLEEKK